MLAGICFRGLYVIPFRYLCAEKSFICGLHILLQLRRQLCLLQHYTGGVILCLQISPRPLCSGLIRVALSPGLLLLVA